MDTIVFLCAGVIHIHMDAYVKSVHAGCLKGTKCPCRMWLQCGFYINRKNQAWRLAHKKIEPEILEYYQQHFSGGWGMHDLFANG